MRTLIFLLALFGTTFSEADALKKRIYLQNGQQIEGKILKETETSYLISTEAGKAILFFDKKDILKIQPCLETREEFLEQIETLFAQNQFQEAKETLELALKLFKNDDVFLVLYARLLFASEAEAQAETLLKNALILSPESARLHFEIALLYKKQNEFAKALHHFKRVRGLVPYTELDQIAKQEMELLRPLLQYPKDASLAEERAFFDTDLGNCYDAFKVAQKLEEMRQRLTPKLPFQFYVQLNAPEKTQKYYESGGNLLLFRSQISYVQLNGLLSLTDWKLSEKEAELLLKSAIRFLHDLYPNAMIVAVASDGQKRLVEGIWAHYREEPVLKKKSF